MRKFRIPYSYRVGGFVEVQAESLQQAKDIAIEASVDNKYNEHYLDDTFQVDDDFCEEVE